MAVWSRLSVSRVSLSRDFLPSGGGVISQDFPAACSSLANVFQMPRSFRHNQVHHTSRLADWRRRLVRHFAKSDRPVTFDSIVSAMPAIREILTPEEATRIADEVAALRNQAK
jgi:hypothetical protein